jgi:hypothetical protein
LYPVWLKHFSVRRNWPQVQTSVPVITSLKQLLDLDDSTNLDRSFFSNREGGRT